MEPKMQRPPYLNVVNLGSNTGVYFPNPMENCSILYYMYCKIEFSVKMLRNSNLLSSRHH